MIHKRLLYILVVFFLLPASSAHTQQQCEILPHGITDLNDPQYVSPTIWDLSYGDKNLNDRFVDGFVEEDSGHVVMIGTRSTFQPDQNSMIIIKVNLRGRTVWERIISDQKFNKVAGVRRLEDGFMVVADKAGDESRPAHIWIGFFNNQGRLTDQSRVDDPKLHLSANDFIPAQGKEGEKRFFLLTQSRPVKGEVVDSSMLYILDERGRPTGKRTYNIGLENGLLSISSHEGDEDGGYFASGYIVNREGRKAGWLVRLNRAGGLVWQRQYARGRAAELVKSLPYMDTHIIVGGTAEPYEAKAGMDVKYRGGWVMLVENTSGEILWERFNVEKHSHMELKDIYIHEDGQIAVIMNALWSVESDKSSILPERQKDFVRLVTINGRGVYLNTENYFNSQGARASRILIGRKKERIILGRSDVLYTVAVRGHDGKGGMKDINAGQAWAMAAESVRPYEDPCL